MAEAIQAGADAIVMEASDHVATALADLQPGQTIIFRVKEESRRLVLLDVVPFGHKVAIADIPEGEHVRKYGEVIGRATTAVAAGKHVHVHNIEGIRGRGDQAKSN
ncbi:UxaA family hydrolase [Paenibacillus contaminans]|uniref:D-galactarate dehydratase n=1 Tax=Paenibacillus contaminans TaxID=450362 RepID=A0A329MFQ8_9BACL|nr:UxaA family hydrolase [Paenibacillus contaminans]RAV18781.1 D-galactarate dehydratase [Paenibacillus contaminans]